MKMRCGRGHRDAIFLFLLPKFSGVIEVRCTPVPTFGGGEGRGAGGQKDLARMGAEKSRSQRLNWLEGKALTRQLIGEDGALLILRMFWNGIRIRRRPGREGYMSRLA